ncbi:phage minor head protein [Streptomyces drozdowiczii]|uniref:Phage head morphogenesis protein n=1 Tax=Streptomyces drozdowiczii TaxID=202862 RepID=A0ABY6PPF4_9ACTN|nr:phage minor head protein [Streptomyces drozdowiczii]MCX0246419.1 phage head morphogenesis protein [Streptomyces drozdowiczii]UZK54078.1 phage head morphogenesis protein [Streptomyces drozdowiczii]
MTTPPDDFLPARLRALAFIRQGEQRIGTAWFRALTRWLDRTRPAVTRGGGVDPARVGDHRQFWTDEVNVEIMPVVAGVLEDAWRRVTRAGDPASDPWTADYLNEAGNRLVRLPDEVYALIVTEVERGIREQDDIPTITAAVDRVLTATGSERWPNRAHVVARTETMAAVNGGVFRAAVLDAEQRGDPAPFKAWLATADARTRPTHRDADHQRTLLTSPFVVGGAQLMYPGDPRGPAQEVIQCRCTMLPVVLGEPIDWTSRGGRDDGVSR